MDLYTTRISEVENHFLQNDLSLGFRRMIDLILDIEDQSFYRKILAYADLFYHQNKTEEEKKSEALNIIQALKSFPSPTIQKSEVLLSTYQLEKSYKRRNFKLHPITFDLRSREVVGLVGENGNGKTTLLRLIGGELKPTGGKISYHFSDAKLFTYQLKSQLVYVPQRIEELYGSLMENLQFTLSSYQITGEENFLLAQVMLARLGLWQYKDLQWKQLSSGYKMRFELARTLLRKPKILLLDEPLANLDIMAQQIILEDLKFLSQSISHPFGVILSSQQLYEVEKVSTEVIFLEKGKLKNQIENSHSGKDSTIIEIDANNTKEELFAVLEQLNLQEIKFNGGSYIAYFDIDVDLKKVLIQIGQSDLDIKYIRDISESSRRFFIN